MTDSTPTAADDDRYEAAADEADEKATDDALDDAGLLPLPDAEPTDGPAPAA